MMANNIDMARDMAGRGFYVFPCAADKKPRISKQDGGNGFHDATNDDQVIKKLWNKYPDAIIGIACKKSGIFVLDLDRHEGSPDGVAMYTDLAAQAGYPETTVGPIQATPGNGVHMIFTPYAMPDTFNIPGQLAPGVDIKYNGYICTGTLPDGRAYQWLPGHGYDAPLNLPPVWVAKMLVRHNQTNSENKLVQVGTSTSLPAGSVSPGDDYNARVAWQDVLPAGWQHTGSSENIEYWTRPGKRTGISATVNYSGHDKMYFFTTNAAPFEAGESYSKFAAYALLHHAGNYSAAAKDLASKGFGKRA